MSKQFVCWLAIIGGVEPDCLTEVLLSERESACGLVMPAKEEVVMSPVAWGVLKGQLQDGLGVRGTAVCFSVIH